MSTSLKSVAAGVLAAAGLGGVAPALEGAYLSPSGMKVTFAAASIHVDMPDGTPIDIPAVESDAARTLYRNEMIEVVVEGETLTVTNPATDPNCPGVVGVYTVVESDAGLTFTPQSDDCEGRKADLSAGIWTNAD
jgi:hypothetical protein